MKNPLLALTNWFKLESELVDIHQKYVYTSHNRTTRENSPRYKDELVRSLLG